MAGIAVLAAAYVLSQFYRSFLAVLTPSLTADLGATNSDLSTASGVWFLAFALMQFVVGVSLDRYGPRRTAALLLLVCGSGGAFLFASATSPWMLVAAMALIGIGCSPVLMASLFIFAKTFKPHRFAVATSWIVAVGMAGNVIGASPLAIAADYFGWRAVMAGLGVLTAISAATIYGVVRDPPETAPSSRSDSGFSGYLEIAKLRVLWPLLPMMMLNYVTAAGIRGLWAGPYFLDVHGADQIAIGNATLFMALAMVMGSVVYGPLDTFFGTRKWVIAAGNTICVATCALLAFQPGLSFSAATALFVIIGLSGSSFGVMMAHARSFIPANMTGRGVTALNFFGIGGVGLMQIVTGAVVSANTVPGSPEVAYQTLFSFYGAIVALALGIYLFGRDAKPNKS